MRILRRYRWIIYAIAIIMFSWDVNGQTVTPNRSLPGSSSTTSNLSPIPGSVLTPSSPGKKSPAPPLQLPSRPRPAPKPVTAVTSTYFHPGMLLFSGTGWDGGDHLFNLTNQMSVYVQIIRPQDDKLDVNEAQLGKIVESIFAGVGIVPQTVATADQPPLPFFQIQILLYPINKGYAAYCGGRLFEAVTPNRIQLEPGMAFQAITWDKDTLLVAPSETIKPQLEKGVAEIAQAFAERFHAYEQRRRDMLGPRP